MLEQPPVYLPIALAGLAVIVLAESLNYLLVSLGHRAQATNNRHSLTTTYAVTAVSLFAALCLGFVFGVNR